MQVRKNVLAQQHLQTRKKLMELSRQQTVVYPDTKCANEACVRAFQSSDTIVVEVDEGGDLMVRHYSCHQG